tara:strand:- start:538 stop:990 length:453 start_codon:yes stop_codon:yes gene_type:complete
MLIRLYTDGACRGNPGPGGAGAYAEYPGDVRETYKKYLGKTTNNKAEYEGVILGLEEILKKGKPCENKVLILTDSDLLVKQINGVWKVKNPGIKPLYDKIKKLLHMANFPAGTGVQHVKGHAGIYGNEKADSLANEAIDDFFAEARKNGN